VTPPPTYTLFLQLDEDGRGAALPTPHQLAGLLRSDLVAPLNGSSYHSSEDYNEAHYSEEAAAASTPFMENLRAATTKAEHSESSSSSSSGR